MGQSPGVAVERDPAAFGWPGWQRGAHALRQHPPTEPLRHARSALSGVWDAGGYHPAAEGSGDMTAADLQGGDDPSADGVRRPGGRCRRDGESHHRLAQHARSEPARCHCEAPYLVSGLGSSRCSISSACFRLRSSAAALTPAKFAVQRGVQRSRGVPIASSPRAAPLHCCSRATSVLCGFAVGALLG